MLFLAPLSDCWAQDKINQCALTINPNVFMIDTSRLLLIKEHLEKIICSSWEQVHDPKLWVDGTFKKWVSPLHDEYYFGYSPLNADLYFYKPIILSVHEKETRLFNVKVAFVRGISESAKIKNIYNYTVIIDSVQCSSLPTLDYNTRGWKKIETAGITFIFPQSHKFNDSIAEQTLKFNKKVSQFFNIPKLQFEFFVTQSTEDFYRAMGYDFDQFMFINNQSSGMADVFNNKIFSGNGTEQYPHEIVHLYVYQKFQKKENRIHRLFNEGLATWMGGSIERTLPWHVAELKKYNKNENIDFNNIVRADYSISDETNIYYTIGGILCEQAYKMYGKENLWELVDNSNSEELVYKNICKVFGVKREEIGKLILELMEKY